MECKGLIEETRDEIESGGSLGPARVASVSKSSFKLKNYSSRQRGGSRREEDSDTFFTELIFLTFLESRRYAGTVRRKLQSSIGELSTGFSGYVMGRGGRAGGLADVRNGAECSFSTVRNRVLGCVNPVTYGGHSGLRARRPPAKGFKDLARH